MLSEISKNRYGKLYLIPNIIHPGTQNSVIAPLIFAAVRETQLYLVENVRTARRYLSSLMQLLPPSERISISDLDFFQLDKDTSPSLVSEMLEPIKSGMNCGIISESGCPGIADPGSEAVSAAHRMNIEVVPLPGPSSIFMALMASGMNGQSFVFHGYLPIDKGALFTRIKHIEHQSRALSQTQIFIETPYRNQRLFDAIINVCNEETLLCIALDITGDNALIKSKKVGEWKSEELVIEKAPVVYLLLAY